MSRPDKFKAMIHYICDRCGDPARLGAIKLNKVAWFSDVIAFLELGSDITGERYVKQKFGPVPKSILPTLRQLVTEGAMRIDEVEYFGHWKKQFVVLQPYNGSLLSDEERGVVDKVMEFVCDGHTATSISEATHDAIWKIADIGEQIPVSAILASKLQRPTSGDIAEARRRLSAKAA
jgi:hypothetical protein